MKPKHMTLGVAAIALMAGTAFAQDTTAPTLDSTAPETEMQSEPTTGMGTDMGDAPAVTREYATIEQMTVGDVLSTIVYGPDDERIGDIDYVVSEPDGPAAVIGIGGFLSIGEYTVAIGLDRFEMTEDGSFMLPIPKEELKELPEFDESGVEGLDDDVLIGDLMMDLPAHDSMLKDGEDSDESTVTN